MSVTVRNINTGYVPREFQAELHAKLKRFSVLVMHRRFGKSVFAINHLIDRALRCTLPNPRFAFIAPTYGAAKRIAWTYIKQYCSMIPGVEFNEAELRVDIPANGARIFLLSAENPNSLRGIYLDGVVLDEFADIPYSVWIEIIRPTLSDRRGWAIFLGTPRGTNHFFELYNHAKDPKNSAEWFAAMFKASETKLIPASELASARAIMDESTYLQEYECSFAAGLVGAYFTKELERAEEQTRITAVPYDPDFVVDTGWDLGVSDATAIWFFQVMRGVPRFIDYYETSGLSLPEIVADLQKKRYVYGEHLLPHDAKARDLSTGKTTEQILYKLGLKRLRVIPRIGSGHKRDSINGARTMINRAYFDRENCAQGLKTLWNYRKKWNEKGQCFEDAPLHDWSSNGSDAFQTVAMGFRKDSESMNQYDSRQGGPQVLVDTAYNPYARRTS